MEFQFGTNWARSRASRAASSARRWRWRACSPSSSSRRSWACSCSARSACRRARTGLRVRRVRRVVAVRLLHRRHRRLDAAPGRLRRGRRRSRRSSTSLSALLLNRWALLAVPAHDGRRARDRAPSRPRAWAPTTSCAGAHATTGACRRRCCKMGVVAAAIASVLAALPDGRPPGPARRAPSTGHAGRDGRAVRDAAAGAPMVLVGPAEHRRRDGSTTRSRFRRLLSFLTYRRWNASVDRARRSSRPRTARTTSPCSITATRDGRPRDDVHRPDGARRSSGCSCAGAC